MIRPLIPACALLVFFVCSVPLSSTQPGSPQNIETFYPSRPPAAPPIANSPPPPTPLAPISKGPPPSPLVAAAPPKESSNGAVAKAVAGAAASSLVIAGFFFFVVRRYTVARRRSERAGGTGPDGGEDVAPGRLNGDLKGLIVDENGLDVIYWRKLEGGKLKNSFRRELQHPKVEKEEDEEMIQRSDGCRKTEPVQEIPLLWDESSTSSNQVWPGRAHNQVISSSGIALKALQKTGSSIHPSTRAEKPESSVKTLTPPPPPLPPPQPPPPPPPLLAIPKKQGLASVSAKKNQAPPPPPPPKTGSLALPSKPLPPPPPPLRPPPAAEPKGMPSDDKPGQTTSRESMTGNANGQVKLKPLHWDKVHTNTDHSMVWDKIDGGSFRFDGDLMEALFGFVATDRKPPQRKSDSINTNGRTSGPPAQIFILEPRRSQNTAIVIRSIAASRTEILESVTDGQGLTVDTLEKLMKIAPTKEEESQILAFEGDPTRLADAESFLFHLLKAIPSAFTRLNAMLFRLNYDSEILHLRESMQTLELGCKELRTRGLFLKLLEAILKAGNRMNVGTARGNAQAFNLNALRKLSDVKSTDRKTTLLHFVVEEVVRSEGKRCILNRICSLSHSSSQSSSNSMLSSESTQWKSKEEREYIMLGLPVVGGISAEFSNVKRAATIDHEAFISTCSALNVRAMEIWKLLAQCGTGKGRGFITQMEGFLKAAVEELKSVKEEQTRVMDLVQRTTEYYQAGASKDKSAHPLQLFGIVNDFLGMVDQVCVDIAKNLQKRKTATATGSAGLSSPKSPASNITVKFPNLPPHFMSDKSRSDSSDTDDDF
ncbi:formin-like protein 8 [Malania oleifera]|uniref:formin-like protein 8 n=1 Tax=Malania oleifera TaxID=397392 RepID=UPI0025AEADD1|nr:formin-like protein 8 [Malania oleifera]